MAEDRIESVIDRTAVENELSATKKSIEDLVALIQSVKAKGISIAGAKSISEYNALNKELQANIDLTNKAAKGITSEQIARQANAKAAKEEAAIIKELIKEGKEAAKAKKLEEDYTKQLIKAKEALNKEAIKEADKVGKLNNAYEQLKFKELQAANTAKQLAAQYGINNEATQDAIAVQGKYYAQLIAIEKAVGQNQRNVGNYTQATTALTQVIREAPAFANSFATGISGISNNVPILVDEIKKLNAANKELQANGLKTIPVFSTLAKSLLSLNGILPIAFLLLQTLGKNLFSSSDGADAAKKSIDALNKSYQDFQDTLKKEIRREDLLNSISSESLRKAGKSRDEIFQSELNSRRANSTRFRQLELEAQKTYNEQLDKQEKIKQAAADLRASISKKQLANLQSITDAAKKNLDDATEQRESYDLETIKLTIANQADIADAERDAAKKRAEERKKAAEDAAKQAAEIAERNRQARFEGQKIILQQDIDFNKEVLDNEKAGFGYRELALLRYSRARQALILLTADFEMATAGKTSQELKLIEQIRSDELLRLEREKQAQRAGIGQKFREDIEKDEEKLKEGLTKIAEDGYKRWKQIQDKQNADKKKSRDEELAKEKELAKAKQDLQKRLASEITTLVFSLATSNIEIQKNVLQDQLNNLEVQKAREIELAGGNADAIAVIEARAQIQRESIQRKQRELDVKKAQFDKAQAVARIIQETAISIVANLKNPALIPLIVAIGAAQLATVLATPIPRYKEGGKHPGGPMIVGDGGKPEGIVFPDGTVMKSPATDTLMTAPAGTVIHKDFNKMMFNSTMTKPVEFKQSAQGDTMVKVVSGLKSVEKAIGKIPQPQITVQNVLKQRIRYGHSINEHIKRNLGK